MAMTSAEARGIASAKARARARARVRARARARAMSRATPRVMASGGASYRAKVWKGATENRQACASVGSGLG